MEDAEFTKIDQMVFDLLHRGSLEPIVVELKDGGTVSGHLLAITRSGAIGRNGGPPSGELVLVAGTDRTPVRYDQIANIR